MSRNFWTVLFSFTCPFFGFGQNFVLVSTGESYGLQNYYRLQDDEQTQIPNDAWDIQFYFPGTGIHINESSKTTFLEPAKELRFYPAPTDDFSVAFSQDDVTGDRLWNEEIEWNNGALNSLRDPNDPKDLGWGRLENNGEITGTRIFVVRLRNGLWKKFKILYRNHFEYKLQYANLDGSDEKQVSIYLPDFSPENFGYFSFEKDQVVINIPMNWDLVFQRYVTPLDDNTGGILDYTVTGVLSNPGVQVAQANQVNPLTVQFDPYRDSLSSQMDAVGYDWKSFDFTNSNEWTVYTDRAYFVLTTSGEIWKIIFIDFEGSATGNIVFQKFKVGMLSGVKNQEKEVNQMTAFPNPCSGNFQIALLSKTSSPFARLSVVNTVGQSFFSENVSLQAGFNVLEIPDLPIAAGIYFLQIQTTDQIFSSRIVRY